MEGVGAGTLLGGSWEVGPGSQDLGQMSLLTILEVFERGCKTSLWYSRLNMSILDLFRGQKWVFDPFLTIFDPF